MSDKIVKLAEYSGIALTNEDIAQWMENWAEKVRKLVPIDNLIVIAEDSEGGMDVISTGRPIDKARLIGLITCAAHYKVDGKLDNIFKLEVT